MKKPPINDLFTYDIETDTINRLDGKDVKVVWVTSAFGNKHRYPCVKYNRWVYPISKIKSKLNPKPDWR